MLILSRVHHLFLFITSSCLNSLISLAEFLKTLPPNIPLPSNSYFLAKTSPISQVTTDIYIFSLLLPSSSSLFLFLLSFSFAGVIFEIVGSKNLTFVCFSLKWLRGSFSKSETVFRGVLFLRFQ